MTFARVPARPQNLRQTVVYEDRFQLTNWSDLRSPMMLIGEFGEVCGIPATTLRFYEAQGLLNAERDQSGYRHYDESSLLQLAKIRILRSVGYSLAEIRELNNAAAADVPVYALAEHLERLDDHLALLLRVRAEIESILITV